MVVCLPEDDAQWLEWAPEQLVIRRCAWWVSLRGAPESMNDSGQTILLPRKQHFYPETLREIMTCLSREETLDHEG